MWPLSDRNLASRPPGTKESSAAGPLTGGLGSPRRPACARPAGIHTTRGSCRGQGRRPTLHKDARRSLTAISLEVSIPFSGAIQRSRNVGEHGHTCHLTASTVAHGCPAPVTICRRLLPVWLPAYVIRLSLGYIHVAALIGRRTTGSYGSPVPGPSRSSVRSSPTSAETTYDCVTARLLVQAAPLTNRPAMSPGAPPLSAADKWRGMGQGWSGCASRIVRHR
jgi:hypothetical protein